MTFTGTISIDFRAGASFTLMADILGFSLEPRVVPVSLWVFG